MIAFIDDHREAYGVEPICRVLPIAPSTYHAHVAQRQDATRLSARARDVADRLSAATGTPVPEAAREVEAALRRIAFYAAWADKLDGRVPAARARHVVLALNEPFGVMGLVCPDEAPLLALASLLMPALAAGNRAVVVPSALHPSAAADLAAVLEAGGVPAGTVRTRVHYGLRQLRCVLETAAAAA